MFAIAATSLVALALIYNGAVDAVAPVVDISRTYWKHGVFRASDGVYELTEFNIYFNQGMKT